jgi:hypothetical protein
MRQKLKIWGGEREREREREREFQFEAKNERGEMLKRERKCIL